MHLTYVSLTVRGMLLIETNKGSRFSMQSPGLSTDKGTNI